MADKEQRPGEKTPLAQAFVDNIFLLLVLGIGVPPHPTPAAGTGEPVEGEGPPRASGLTSAAKDRSMGVSLCHGPAAPGPPAQAPRGSQAWRTSRRPTA